MTDDAQDTREWATLRESAPVSPPAPVATPTEAGDYRPAQSGGRNTAAATVAAHS
jgi:hypothetical protein